ncbi:MAG: phosphatase PAP2 family protein [Legionella sp.]|nr:phosphatase PAP2 family protein [Legionella sp.]
MILCLIYMGVCLLLGQHSRAAKKTREVLYLFLVMAVIAIGSTAIQYTPFKPIDQSILNGSQWMHLDLTALMHWSATHPMLYHSMEVAYDSIPLQMAYLPLVLILFGQFERLHEYYFLLLLTAFIGYTFYYFFPTTAPASILESPYFTEAQHATGLKFHQIHAHIKPTTLEGGMIAFPSFHVIWAWLCAFMVRDWPLAFMVILTLNIAVTFSCVLLGWHYILDVIASVMVLLFSYAVYSKAYPK